MTRYFIILNVYIAKGKTLMTFYNFVMQYNMYQFKK